ncbi:hypothetical protein IscW_ISCW013367 [Ixodes scapularis]|uniref:Uncharacterized protein n=1 Tax=Ixodes scapularis TaxID=6945 RepID=B7QCE9_IXOSC|nr:hypothetical protein IscW_ISCW013367 [Ixodes scapularis]|eukprot:XP_002413213.1 hypothetical protein IscW_ISCW013367 [Ixodes scapularis]
MVAIYNIKAKQQRYESRMSNVSLSHVPAFPHSYRPTLMDGPVVHDTMGPTPDTWSDAPPPSSNAPDLRTNAFQKPQARAPMLWDVSSNDCFDRTG